MPPVPAVFVSAVGAVAGVAVFPVVIAAASLGSSSQYARACFIMLLEKSLATTCANTPLAANLLAVVPQCSARVVCPSKANVYNHLLRPSSFESRYVWFQFQKVLCTGRSGFKTAPPPRTLIVDYLGNREGPDLENKPLPQLTSSTTPPSAAGRMYSMANLASTSSPGNPAHAKLCRHPFSYTELMTSLWNSLVPDFCGSL